MIPSPAPETREKLFAQRTFELSMNDISHWGDYKLSMVDDIIDEIDKRVQDRGWGHDAFKECAVCSVSVSKTEGPNHSLSRALLLGPKKL